MLFVANDELESFFHHPEERTPAADQRAAAPIVTCNGAQRPVPVCTPARPHSMRMKKTPRHNAADKHTFLTHDPQTSQNRQPRPFVWAPHMRRAERDLLHVHVPKVRDPRTKNKQITLSTERASRRRTPHNQARVTLRVLLVITGSSFALLWDFGAIFLPEPPSTRRAPVLRRELTSSSTSRDCGEPASA